MTVEEQTDLDRPDLDRPASITAAVVLTLIVSLITFSIGLFVVYGLVSDRDDFVDRLSRDADLQDVDADTVYAVLLAVAVVLLVWCLVAMVLAILTLRRSNTARVLLVVSAAVTALLSLPGVLFVLPVFTLLCGASVVVMLVGRNAKEWATSKPR